MIDAIFHVVNLVLLAATLIYLFRRYALEPLRRAMASGAIALTHLADRLSQALALEKKLVRAERHQTQVYDDLMGKIQQWRKALELEHEHTAQTQEELTAACIRRNELLARGGAEKRLCRAMMTDVLPRVQQELAQWSAQQKNCNTYTRAAVESLASHARGRKDASA